MAIKALTFEQLNNLKRFVEPFGIKDKECSAEAAIRIIVDLQNQVYELQTKLDSETKRAEDVLLKLERQKKKLKKLSKELKLFTEPDTLI